MVKWADDAAILIHDATMQRVDLAEAIAFTDSGEFAGADGFAKLVEEDTTHGSTGTAVSIERAWQKPMTRWTDLF